MRLVLPILAALAVMFAAREAWATCSGCCDNAAELLGWSKDGRTYAVKEQIGFSPQVVIYRDGKELERWGGDKDDPCLFGGAKPRMPADTFSRHQVEPFEPAWRDDFKTDYRMVPGRQPVKLGDLKCNATDVVVNGDGRVVASFVRECVDDGCVRGNVGNGHVHPSKKFMLVRTTVTSCGHTSTTSYRLVKLKG